MTISRPLYQINSVKLWVKRSLEFNTSSIQVRREILLEFRKYLRLVRISTDGFLFDAAALSNLPMIYSPKILSRYRSHYSFTHALPQLSGLVEFKTRVAEHRSRAYSDSLLCRRMAEGTKLESFALFHLLEAELGLISFEPGTFNRLLWTVLNYSLSSLKNSEIPRYRLIGAAFLGILRRDLIPRRVYHRGSELLPFFPKSTKHD